MTKFLIYLSNIIILCSTPFITPYLIPHYTVIVSLLLISLYKGVKIARLGFEQDFWTKSIQICVVAAIAHGILTFGIFYDEFGEIGLRNAIGMSMRYFFILISIPLIKRFFNYYHSVFWGINIIIIVLAILLFFLCLCGIYLPYVEFSPDGREHYFFYIGSTNHMAAFGDRVFIRIAGYCDEPGRLALVLTYLLVLNEYTFRNKYIRILLCFAGFLTFSAAFFITLVPIVVYWCIKRIIQVKSIFKGVIIGCIVLSVFYLKVDDEIQENIDDAIELFITNRFRKGEDGKYKGDNRSEAIGLQIETFCHSPLVGVLGKGLDYEIRHKVYTPTFFTGLARYGLFDLLFYLPFVLLLYKYWRKKERWLYIAIGLNFLQRPEIENMFFLIVLSFLYYIDCYQGDSLPIQERQINESCRD